MTAETASLPKAEHAAEHLKTLRDVMRYAITQFTRANLFFGHGTFTPHDEAAYLVLQGLDLPIDQLEPSR